MSTTERSDEPRLGPSRRQMLAAGGAAGAYGVLRAATPASAHAWTWSAKGSVAGSSAGVPPEWVWDDEADPVVASLLDRGDVPQVNAILRTWKKNDQPLPDGLPGDLHAFIQKARQLPEWADMGKLADAVTFNEKRGLYLGLQYGLGSGMLSTAIPKEARAVYYSKGGTDMRSRISRTAKLGYDVGSPTAYFDDGEMIVTAVKTRLVHAAVRHLLPQSPGWTGSAPEDIPISQRDMMVTWHSLPTFVMRKMNQWNLRLDEDEAEGFLHSWQVTAHMLGILDEFVPATWDDAESQAVEVLDPALGPTPEGVALADILLNLGATVDGGIATRPFLESFTRYMHGDRVAEWFEIPRHPMLDTMIAGGWPPFVAFREMMLPFPFVPKGYWTFDEFLRLAALFFLSQGQPISIEIPEGNREYYD